MKLFKSIRWRLLVWQMILLAGVLLTLLTLHYQLKKRDLIAAVDAELQEALMVVMPGIAPPQGDPQLGMPPPRDDMRFPNDRPPPRQRLPQLERPVDEKTTEFLAELEQHDLYLAVQDARGIERYGQVPESLANDMPKAAEQTQKVIRDGNRELIQSHQKNVIVLGRPLTEVYAKLSATRLYLIGIGGAVLAIGFMGGLLIIGRALRPIQKISDTAKTIAEGDHQQRIELSDAPEELSGLADTLNNTFDHLHESIENQKRFSADASHELRTPIAVVIAQTEAALKRNRSPEEYKEVLNACLRAGRRMKSMANSLLELTRLSTTGFELFKERYDLNTILTDAVDSASLLSKKHSIDFQCLPVLPVLSNVEGSEVEGRKPLEVDVDSDRIHQVMMNLISNAMQHNPQGCEITIRLKEGRIIEIVDNGIGIPEEHLPHIFERFYRVDKSRSREQGGAGLGLSIVQSLVEAHGGTIAVASVPTLGTTFTITLPLK